MIGGTYKLRICLGAPIPGFPVPRVKQGIENEKISSVEEILEGGFKKIEHTVCFTELPDGVVGVHTTEHGPQTMQNLVVGDSFAAWDIYTGSEGVELFHYVMCRSEGTDDFVGFQFGLPPYFRGYLPFEGEKI